MISKPSLDHDKRGSNRDFRTGCFEIQSLKKSYENKATLPFQEILLQTKRTAPYGRNGRAAHTAYLLSPHTYSLDLQLNPQHTPLNLWVYVVVQASYVHVTSTSYVSVLKQNFIYIHSYYIHTMCHTSLFHYIAVTQGFVITHKTWSQ